MPATIPSSESALPWLSVTDLRVGAKPVAPSSALVDGSWAPRPKALGFRFRRRSQWLGHRLLLQRVIEHFVERVDVGDLDIAENIGCKVGHDVGLVVRRLQHFLDPRAFGPKHLFLVAAA